MEVFVYSRDAPGAGPLREDEALGEAHWSYMDGYAASMVARGPTLTPDRETATGSLHVLGLPSVAAAHDFVEREPNNRAGVYAEHRLWRFRNLLGRTMWDVGAAADQLRFLVIALSRGGAANDAAVARIASQRLPDELSARLVLHGALATLAEGVPVGISLALQARDRAEASALLGRSGLGLDAFCEVELHDWEFGGRR